LAHFRKPESFKPLTKVMNHQGQMFLTPDLSSLDWSHENALRGEDMQDGLGDETQRYRYHFREPPNNLKLFVSQAYQLEGTSRFFDFSSPMARSSEGAEPRLLVAFIDTLKLEETSG